MTEEAFRSFTDKVVLYVASTQPFILDKFKLLSTLSFAFPVVPLFSRFYQLSIPNCKHWLLKEEFVEYERNNR